MKKLTIQQLVKLFDTLDLSNQYMLSELPKFKKTFKSISSKTALFYDQMNNININNKVFKNLDELLGEVNLDIEDLINNHNLNSIKYLTNRYQTSYKEYSRLLADDVSTISKDEALNKVLRPWLEDGLNASDRILRTKGTLIKDTNNTIEFGIKGNKTITRIITNIESNVSKNYNSNYKISRTETTNALGDTLKTVMRDNGYEKYEYIAVLDDRTSEICRELDSKIFHLSEAEKGVNYPPMHVNCRSTIRPIIS